VLEKFSAHHCLGLCGIYCGFCSFWKSNIPVFSMELPFCKIFFFWIYSLLTPSMLPIFMCRQAQSWKNKNIGVFFFISWKDINHQFFGWCYNYRKFYSLWKSNVPMFAMELLFMRFFFLENFWPSHILNDAVFYV